MKACCPEMVACQAAVLMCAAHVCSNAVYTSAPSMSAWSVAYCPCAVFRAAVIAVYELSWVHVHRQEENEEMGRELAQGKVHGLEQQVI